MDSSAKTTPRTLLTRLGVAVGMALSASAALPAAARAQTVDFPVAFAGDPQDRPLSLDKAFDRMIAAKLGVAYEARVSLPVALAALRTGMSRPDFVRKSSGKASPRLLGTYYDEMMPWIAQTVKLAKSGSDQASPAELADFLNATKRVHQARLAVVTSGTADYSWVERVAGAPNPSMRGIYAIFAQTQRQAQPFRHAGVPQPDSFMAYVDFARVGDARLDGVDKEAKADFLRRAGLAVGTSISGKVDQDKALSGYFEAYAEGMHKFSGVGAYALGHGANKSPNVRADLMADYKIMDQAIRAAHDYATVNYPRHLLHSSLPGKGSWSQRRHPAAPGAAIP